MADAAISICRSSMRMRSPRFSANGGSLAMTEKDWMLDRVQHDGVREDGFRVKAGKTEDAGMTNREVSDGPTASPFPVCPFSRL